MSPDTYIYKPVLKRAVAWDALCILLYLQVTVNIAHQPIVLLILYPARGKCQAKSEKI